jgi:hypothetical protein
MIGAMTCEKVAVDEIGSPGSAGVELRITYVTTLLGVSQPPAEPGAADVGVRKRFAPDF